MTKRTCPECGNIRYSANTGDWTCECGAKVTEEHEDKEWEEWRN